MKKNYTLLICAFLLSTGLFAQTNLLLNPTFTSGDDWRGDAVGGCTGAEIGTYDSSETNTADGSGCWQINACDNTNNRLQSAAAFAVDMDNYTFTFYVKGTAGQVVTPWFFVTGSGNVLPVEGDYTIEATGVWEQVVRTHDIPAAANVTARIRLKTVNSSIKVDDVSLVLTSSIVDTTAPVITLLGDDTVTVEVGSVYTDAGATAIDNYDGDISSSIVTVNPVDTNTVGTYIITYNVSDVSGNVALEVTRTVNVVDTTLPVITLLGDNPVTIEVGSTYTDAGATATDTYDGDITSSIVTVSTVNTAIVGVYTVTYNVSDASGNAAVEVIRTVNVEDALSFENFEQIKFSLFPNPSTGDITVMYYLPGLMDGVLAEVYDMLGRLVWTQVIEQEQGMQQANLNLNSLQKGNYIVMISAGNNRGEKFVNNKIIILK
jgi:hypothetical protein